MSRYRMLKGHYLPSNHITVHKVTIPDIKYLHQHSIYGVGLNNGISIANSNSGNSNNNGVGVGRDIVKYHDKHCKAPLSRNMVYTDDETLRSHKLLSYMHETRLMHFDRVAVSQSVYSNGNTTRQVETMDNTWIQSICPTVVEYFNKHPYFDYYNPIGGSIVLTSAAAQRSTCLLHIAGTIASHLGAVW